MFDSAYDNLWGGFKLFILISVIAGLSAGLAIRQNLSSGRAFYHRQIWFLPRFRAKLRRLVGLSYAKYTIKY